MSKGITIIAIGNIGYLRWAHNMVVSLKYNSPKVAVQLLVGEDLYDEAKKIPYFSIITKLPKAAYTDSSGALFPAKLKLKLYEYLYFDETIYLDVDGLMFKDVTPLFDTKANISGDIQGVYDTSQGELFDHLKWAKPAVIYNHYNLPDTANLPAINSSYVFIRKSDDVRELYRQAYKNLQNPIPYEMQWHHWGRKMKGKNTQPDELYLDVAMAQLGIIPEHNVVVHFRMINESGEYVTVETLKENHYGLGLFGDMRINHLSIREAYDAQIKKMWREIEGGYPPYLHNTLGKSKFVTNN